MFRITEDGNNEGAGIWEKRKETRDGQRELKASERRQIKSK